MRVSITYFVAGCLIALGSGMGLFVLAPNIVKYQTFKDAPKAPITEMAKLERRYKRPIAVEYKYRYQGKAYTGKQFASFWTFTQDDDRFRAVQSRNSIGSDYFCYVNSANPSEAVLVNDFDYFSFWVLTLGFVLFPTASGIYTMFCGRYEKRNGG